MSVRLILCKQSTNKYLSWTPACFLAGIQWT